MKYESLGSNQPVQADRAGRMPMFDQSPMGLSDEEDGNKEEVESRPTKITMVEKRISVTKQSPTKNGDSDVEDEEEVVIKAYQANPFAIAKDLQRE